MRTTLALDDDLAAKLRSLAHQQRRPFKELVNFVLRRGLAAQERPVPRARRFRVDTFRSTFKAGVEVMKLNQLADELEVEHAVATLRAAIGQHDHSGH